MAWRVLDVGDDVWNVTFAAERPANSDQWQLVLTFRSAGSGGRRFWAPYPIRASSKAAIYSQADTISDQDLIDVLNEHLAQP